MQTTEVLLYVTQDATPVVPVQDGPRAATKSNAKRPSTCQDMFPAMRMALENARIEKKLSIEEFSMITGITSDTLRRYESGADFPNAKDIATLQTHLETTLGPK